ncbi:Palm thioest domain containing protein [Trichuris trichiura]|uniref:Palmitoyl-protein thioesterase 1 n=1 Tax=Trichuris trichiura TaxID=36087 RepID=A0A077Z837_TRITR|nr:Palm thioest domain containing protein [Trichuris trichiura]
MLDHTSVGLLGMAKVLSFHVYVLLPMFLTCVADPTPVVMWHGMGDTCCNPRSMNALKTAIENEIPGVYVLSLSFGDTPAKDMEASYFGNVNEQVANVCRLLADDARFTKGYHAIGISQGSQFLRAVAQRCERPRMRNLISIGGQHQGVFGIPRCNGSRICHVVRHLLNHGAYVPIVQAQYWHDPLDEAVYKEKSIFIADINNERVINETYVKKLGQLENFVMVKFTEDTMVVPPESSWFGFFEPGQEKRVLPLEETALYKEVSLSDSHLWDRLGLKKLKEEKRLHFLEHPGDHIRMTMQFFIEEIVRKFIAV